MTRVVNTNYFRQLTLIHLFPGYTHLDVVLLTEVQTRLRGGPRDTTHVTHGLLHLPPCNLRSKLLNTKPNVRQKFLL